MPALFTIATDRARLTWSEVRGTRVPMGTAGTPKYGLLALRLLRPGARFEADASRESPVAAVSAPNTDAGPALFEQNEYRITLRGVDGRDVVLDHRDPLILNRFDDGEPGRFDGLVNFRSQIGISTFRVTVDDTPEFEFDVEVFPTKLDYRSDYDEILAEVQEILTGLAFEYLRATWQGAETVASPKTTHIEWLTLLRSVVDEFDRALRYIASRPIRGLRRAEVSRRGDQIRRVDSGIRSFLRKRAQRGGVTVVGEISVPERMTERGAQPTLDTPEHRWLASQVVRVRRRLAELIEVEVGRNQRRPSERAAATVAELRRLEARASQWSLLEPLQAATEPPPSGFASLQLLTAPGYREAYRTCMTLSLGLRLEGGPLQLSVKDLNLLYEYWCY